MARGRHDPAAQQPGWYAERTQSESLTQLPSPVRSSRVVGTRVSGAEPASDELVGDTVASGALAAGELGDGSELGCVVPPGGAAAQETRSRVVR